MIGKSSQQRLADIFRKSRATARRYLPKITKEFERQTLF